jgi:hypothetical protein
VELAATGRHEKLKTPLRAALNLRLIVDELREALFQISGHEGFSPAHQARAALSVVDPAMRDHGEHRVSLPG